jgi:hypothetical protein
LTDDPQAMGCCITFAPKQGSRSRRHRRVSGISYALKTGRSRVTFDGNGSGNGICGLSASAVVVVDVLSIARFNERSWASTRKP